MLTCSSSNLRLNEIVCHMSKFGCLVSRSMLNCVNALEQRLPASERAALMVAEEKPLPDSCKHPSLGNSNQAGVAPSPRPPSAHRGPQWEQTSFALETAQPRPALAQPKHFQTGRIFLRQRDSCYLLSILFARRCDVCTH